MMVRSFQLGGNGFVPSFFKFRSIDFVVILHGIGILEINIIFCFCITHIRMYNFPVNGKAGE
jgi:hypothetical protein